jgi:hypothetical protein
MRRRYQRRPRNRYKVEGLASLEETSDPFGRLAQRLLGEGRLLIRLIDGGWIRATARGDHGTYDLGPDPGGWWCSAPPSWIGARTS